MMKESGPTNLRPAKPLRMLWAGVLVFLVGAPVSLIVTFLLLPFWRWLESLSGIEVIGHSGPAGWCFLVVFLLIVSGSVFVWYQFRSGS